MKTITKSSVILTSFTTLLLMSVNTQAKIYKWVDDKGQVHYTAQPPVKNSIKATNIEDKIRAHAGTKSSTRSTSAKETVVALADEKQTEELAGPDKKLIKYCEGQRLNVAQLRKNFRNVWVDAKGNETSLTQEQRKEKVAKINAQIKEHCSEVKVTNKTT